MKSKIKQIVTCFIVLTGLGFGQIPIAADDIHDPVIEGFRALRSSHLLQFSVIDNLKMSILAAALFPLSSIMHLWLLGREFVGYSGLAAYSTSSKTIKDQMKRTVIISNPFTSFVVISRRFSKLREYLYFMRDVEKYPSERRGWISPMSRELLAKARLLAPNMSQEDFFARIPKLYRRRESNYIINGLSSHYVSVEIIDRDAVFAFVEQMHTGATDFPWLDQDTLMHKDIRHYFRHKEILAIDSLLVDEDPKYFCRTRVKKEMNRLQGI